MAVEKVDANLPRMTPVGQESAQEVAQEASADDAKRRKQVKKEVGKAQTQELEVYEETFNRTESKSQRKLQNVLGKSAPETQQALNTLNQLQGNRKLNNAQRQLFENALTKNPEKAAKSVQVFERLSQTEGFNTAVTDRAMVTTLAQEVIEEPSIEEAANELFEQSFLREKKNDSKTQKDAFKHYLSQFKKGGTEKLGMKAEFDMLQSVSQSGVSKEAVRASYEVARSPSGGESGLENIDSFVKSVAPKLTKPVASEGVITLSKARGDGEVKASLNSMADNATFQKQSPSVQVTAFKNSSIGKTTSDIRAMTDLNLKVMQNGNLPDQQSQVKNLLNRVADKARKEGASQVDVGAEVKRAKRESPLEGLDGPLDLESTEGLSEEQARRVRSRNRAKIISRYQAIQGKLDGLKKNVGKAKCREDISEASTDHRKLKNLKTVLEGHHLEMTEPDDLALVEGKQQKLLGDYEALGKEIRKKNRSLKGSKRRRQSSRAAGTETKTAKQGKAYFKANASETNQLKAFMSGAPVSGGSGGETGPAFRGEADIASQVAEAMAKLKGGPVTQEVASQVATAIASKVAEQVAGEVARQLMEGAAPTGARQSKPEPDSASKSTVQGKTNDWGMPLGGGQKDLGGGRPGGTEQKSFQEAWEHPAATDRAVANTLPVSGKSWVDPSDPPRSLMGIMDCSWKALKPAERQMLRMLGWELQRWNARESVDWPPAMKTQWEDLSENEQQAVGQLGVSRSDWNMRARSLESAGKKIGAMSMGRNA
ncbi:MAG: hypothetical protein VYA34_05240 [Myxococcota bacterium]|nr:hypothetical protein [Myxococcota bacterium]